MVDELAYAGAEHLDPGFVAGFDRKQGYPDPAGDLAALREHGVGRASTVVDLGAGTGRKWELSRKQHQRLHREHLAGTAS
jgi:hypothetical protein